MQKYRNSTKNNYYKVWKIFNEFFVRLDDKPMMWEDRIVLFAAHLINERKQSQTVHSYLSVIKAVLSDNDIQVNEDRYLLNSITRACKLNYDRAINIR